MKLLLARIMDRHRRTNEISLDMVQELTVVLDDRIAKLSNEHAGRLESIEEELKALSQSVDELSTRPNVSPTEIALNLFIYIFPVQLVLTLVIDLWQRGTPLIPTNLEELLSVAPILVTVVAGVMVFVLTRAGTGVSPEISEASTKALIATVIPPAIQTLLAMYGGSFWNLYLNVITLLMLSVFGTASLRSNIQIARMAKAGAPSLEIARISMRNSWAENGFAATGATAGWLLLLSFTR